MQGTRDNVLEFIVQHREVRVEELAEELGVTTAAVRRHLDHLRADGMVDMRAVKQSTGRPYYAYHPTERALGSLPDGYASILERVLRSVEGREGVAEQMAESVAQRRR